MFVARLSVLTDYIDYIVRVKVGIRYNAVLDLVGLGVRSATQ